MNRLESINALRKKAVELGLEDCCILLKYTDEELASRYNGIGPECFPGWLRWIVGVLNPALEPVALIHDVEWSETDRTKESWKASNDRFYRNGMKVAKTYPWWSPLRCRVMYQSVLFRMACNTETGWKAWQDGDSKFRN